MYYSKISVINMWYDSHNIHVTADILMDGRNSPAGFSQNRCRPAESRQQPTDWGHDWRVLNLWLCQRSSLHHILHLILYPQRLMQSMMPANPRYILFSDWLAVKEQRIITSRMESNHCRPNFSSVLTSQLPLNSFQHFYFSWNSSYFKQQLQIVSVLLLQLTLQLR